MIYEKVFVLIGINNYKFDDVLCDWYYEMVEKMYGFDIFNDEKKLLEIVVKIVMVLNDLYFSRNKVDKKFI